MMNLNVDIGTALLGAGMSVTAIIAYVWLKIGPLEEDVKEIKDDMKKIKTEDELKRMMEIQVMKHERGCRQDRLTETGTIRVQPIHGHLDEDSN